MSLITFKTKLITLKDQISTFFSSAKPSKRLIGVGVVLGCILMLSPNISFGLFGIGEFASSAVMNIIFTASYLVSFVAGVFMALLAWAIEIILTISRDIPNSAVVKYGFPVTLAIANLCLVLGIIVIAIMTILRNETYAAKKILSSLIIMAITINFGLVICSVLLNFSDSLSLYFLRAAQDPGAGQTGDDGLGIINFTNAIVGAFQPQRLFGETFDSVGGGVISGGNTKMQQIGTTVAGFLSPITSLIFVILVLVCIIVVLFTLFGMLLYRYVALSFLMVILPVAWVCWVFPAFQQYWKQWWDSFIKQAFFAPIVLFFLWLSIQTSYEINEAGGSLFNIISKAGVGVSQKNSAFGLLTGVFEGFFSGIAAQLLQAGILLGLMIGGMMIADKMGIQFAKAATEAAKSSVKGMAGYAGRRTSGGAARAVTEQRRPYVPLPPGANLLTRVRTAGSNIGIALGNGAKRVASATRATALVNSEAAQKLGVTNAVKSQARKTDFMIPVEHRKKAQEYFEEEKALRAEADEQERLARLANDDAGGLERAAATRTRADKAKKEGDEWKKKAEAAEKINPTLFSSVFVPPARKVGEEFGLVSPGGAHLDKATEKKVKELLGMHDDHAAGGGDHPAPAAGGGAPAAH